MKFQDVTIPKKMGTNSWRAREPVRITVDDIEDEVNFWKPSLVGYVAGANPPLFVFEGFVRRVWKENVDKVGMISHGVFIVQFKNEEIRDGVLHDGFIFFDKNPFIMQAWNSVDNFTKKKLDVVPTWIQIRGLELKYWGQKSLFKIVEQIESYCN